MTIDEIKNIHGNLPVYCGTGYPIEKPHILVIDKLPDPHAWVYPRGDTGCSGLGLNTTHSLNRKSFLYPYTPARS